MTVRVSASLSRNGSQRGRPPRPARKPSLGPWPLVQTRQGKPLTSTVAAFGSDTSLLRRGELRAEGRHGGTLGPGQRLWAPLVLPLAGQGPHLWHQLLGG